MTLTESLLAFIGFQLVIIWIYIRWVYIKLEYGQVFDPMAPTNQYGEGLSEGIQNAIERGQRGINTND